MRTKRVLLDYSELYDHELNTLAGRVLDCLDGHPVLTEPPVTVGILEEQAADFRTKWQIASNGGSSLQRAEKNDAKAVLSRSLKDIAFYVNKVAAGSRSVLLSSGLLLEADPKPSRAPQQVTGVTLADGRQKNQLLLGFQSLRGKALFYEYEFAEELDGDGMPDWRPAFLTSDSRGNVYAPTIPGRTYYVRVRARNKKGIGDWSETVSILAR
ncbi:fibronectin type III domain-containing protein [Sphingobacterium corticibacterium]|uniref:Fibronectin type III domain-containing protein n=1 Tax=Sphingobacterium corticibacterium TaxID=2484746 RepID=A0A4Q6XGA0_9SPHI|nr:fibronectin type III domain-containing protein [Sphingobacterium corticibacterium]RZF58920.1 fibronectin type III domain-containing protein [Sphingobacterium corticibacterium]